MLEETIEKLYGAGTTTLKESGIEVFRSVQVTLRKTDKKLKYKEISIGQLPDVKGGRIKTKANPKTLEKQSLQTGDILVSARSKLAKVGMIRKRDLNDEIPTVAMNGILIIRTGSEERGYFIKSYLELPEVQKYVNEDPRTVKNGKRVITVDTIQELPFPDTIQKDFSSYKNFMELHKRLMSRSTDLHAKISRLGNIQLAKATTQDLTDPDSYNINDWKQLENDLNNAQKHVDLLIEKVGARNTLFRL